MNLREDIERIKEVMGLEMKPKVVRKAKFTNKYGEEITMVLFDDGDVNFKHTDLGDEFLPIKSLIRKDFDGNLRFKVILHQEEKDFVNNFLQDTKYQSDSQTITESREMFFKRRQSEYLDDIHSSFEWVEVEEADSFEEYIEMILRHSIDTFFGHNDILATTEEEDELLPIALQTLRNDGRLLRRIRRHYDTYNSSRNFDETITESKDRFLMRREFEFNKYVNNHFGNVNPQRFDSFEDYLKYVLRYAIMIFFSNVGDEGDLKPNEMEELIPIALHHLENNRDLYKEIKKEFFKEIHSEQQSEKSESVIYESDINFFKRREKLVMGELQRMFDLIPPIYNNSLVDYVDQLVLEAIISLYNRGGQLEGVSQELIYQVHPIVKEMLLDNKDLLNKIKNQFKLYHPFKSTQMNESRENNKKLDNSIYNKIEIKKSEIDGLGVFAKEDIKKDTTYLYAIIKDGSYFGGDPIRYLNHSYDPNIKNTKIGNKIYGRTIKDIKRGDELTSNYDDNEYTLSYDEMLKINYHDLLDVKKIKSNIPFFNYKITPKLFT